jgi:tRNA threonylcarbamoyl adenosine modification protein YeaZ
MNQGVILAIETGISYGSLSILKAGSELDFWIGENKISRSDDLLSNIDDLFSRIDVSKHEIKKIAVSTGPGSFTGVRIGIATAIGLAKALSCECIGISLLEAMTSKSKSAGEVVVAFGIGENEICWQIFKTDKLNQIQPINESKIGIIDDFCAELKNYSCKNLICDRDLYDKFLENENSIDIGDFEQIQSIGNPAKYIGIRSEELTLTSNLSPLYARDARIS